MSLGDREVLVSDGSISGEKSEVIESLKQFNKDFVIKFDADKKSQEANNHDKGKLEDGKKKLSIEMEQKKDELKAFQKSFHLGSKNNTQHQEVPTQLSIAGPLNNNLSLGGGASPRHYRNKVPRKKRKPPPKNEEFADMYELTGEVLGKGARSSVTTCIRKSTGKEFAVKIVPKTTEHEREKVLREVEILYLCRENRTILHLVESFEDKECFYLVFEKMLGGPLLAHIQCRERFTEKEASMVVREVAEALAFLHKRGVAHRDLKPENILCERVDQVVPVRICDFDLSFIVSSGGSTQSTPVSTPMLHTPVGSAEFMAPEVVDTFLGEEFSYNKMCDLWSLGVTLYMMLSGHPPFNGRCGQECGWERGENCSQCQDMLLSKIKNCEYSFPKEQWEGISSEAKDLIGQLLQTNAKLRPTAENVLQHPWLQQAVPDTPLQTPGVLSRFPGFPSELSSYAASCINCERRRSSRALEVGQSDLSQKVPSAGSSPSPLRAFNLSPPGSSELAVRREAPHHEPREL